MIQPKYWYYLCRIHSTSTNS